MTSIELSECIASSLSQAGTTTVFGMPGGGNNLDFIGAIEEAGMRFVLAHAETPAAIMAAVYGDLTDTPGACVVTRGPGAASAVNGVAHAFLDRQPLVLVTDAVSSADRERIAHQQVDQRRMLAPITKWNATIGSGDPDQTAAHAVSEALTSPRGPVHLDFDPCGASTPPPPGTRRSNERASELSQLGEMVAQASRPVVCLGVGAREAAPVVRALFERSPAPVLMTYRAKGLVPDSWSSAAGLLSGATTEAPLLAAADLIVMIGVDSVEFIPNPWPYRAAVVSLNSWAESSRYLTPAIEVVGDLEILIAKLAQSWPATTWDADAGNRHRDFELDRLLAARPAAPKGLVPQDVVRRTRAAAPAGTVATVDAGAHMLPAMSLWTTEDLNEIIISSGLATMGFALPAAIAAALARPERRVVCFTGDGGLGMCLGELETLSRLDLKVTVIVFNDSRLSLIAIKAKPEANGGAHPITEYTRIDFATVGRGYGLLAARAATTEELDQAIQQALGHDGPSIIDACVDPSGYPEVLAAIRGERT
ncbi:MAG TPA: thiamine pyrophosphate-binding protein [Streptosporangiaceae bacterium]|nr:thiamine pyrophosphate-binding protein [Streptosporangiaceae bacterium]